MPLLPHRLPALLGMTLTAAAFGTHTYAADTMQDMDIHGMRTAAVHVPDGTASADAPLYEFTLDEIVVTGYRTRTPLTLITDPQQPRQPVPAADGGGYLKTIPGFSLVRKGGVSGDPMLRGMGGTRVMMEMNGGMMNGGCPNRMDPTTTYAFPETFSSIIVNKGPQSVRYGASVAGSVIFERETERLRAPGVRGSISVLGASNHRFDDLVDVTAGSREGYARFIQTRSYARDYKDGDGHRVHSGYGRHSLTGILGFTPDPDTLFEFSYDRSRGHAKFAHGMMDGVKFDRDSYAVKYERTHLSPLVTKLALHFNHDVIDHLMDNYSLRPAPRMGMGSDVKRTQYGVRLIADLAFSPRSTGAVGLDLHRQAHYFSEAHRGRARGDFNNDMDIQNFGVFLEYNQTLKERARLRSGLRFDRQTTAYHNALFHNAMGRRTRDLIPGSASEHAVSGFVRYERDAVQKPLTFYVGVGHAERPADYWEAFKTWEANSNRSRGQTAAPSEARPAREKNTQIDLGWVYAGEKENASLSLYCAHISDFILRQPTGAYGNVNARLYGLEAEYTRTVSPHWTLGASLAYTRGDDRTNRAALPQIAPLEANLTAKYQHGKGEANLICRLVSKQNRYHEGYGSVTGTDHGPTGGFGTLSLSLAYRPRQNISLSLGVDNLLDKTYTEFVNYSEAEIIGLGIPARGHINEPGRTVWLKTNYQF